MVKSKICTECGARVKNMSQHWYRMHNDLRATIPASRRSGGFKDKPISRILKAVKTQEPPT